MRKWRFPVPMKDSNVQGFIPPKVTGVVVDTPGPAVAPVDPISAAPAISTAATKRTTPTRGRNRAILALPQNSARRLPARAVLTPENTPLHTMSRRLLISTEPVEILVQTDPVAPRHRSRCRTL